MSDPEGQDPAPPAGSLQTGGLGRRAARGAALTVSAQAIRILVQMGGVVLFARLLSPHDFGLVAMVVAVVGVGELLRDFGLSSAAVQAPSLSTQQRTNLLWLNTALGLVFGVAVLAGAPLLASVYGEPALTDIARALSPVFLINGLATQYRADLTRHMLYRKLALVDVTGPVLGLAAGLALAAGGAGWWALVVQQLTTAFALLVGVVVMGRWVPGLPRRGEPMRDLLRFGSTLLTTQVIQYAANNIDNVTIGIRFGAVDLGLYNRAYSLLMQPLSQLRVPTTNVALPTLTRLRDDPARFRAFVERGQLAMAYTLVAALFLVIAAADPLVEVLLGPQWTQTTPLLRLLAAAGVFQTLAYVGYWVYLATGLTSVLLRYTLVSSALRIVGVLVGSIFGLVGVATGYVLATAISWPLSLWWLSHRTQLSLRALMSSATRVLLSFGVSAAAGWAVSTVLTAPWPQLLAAVGAAALTQLVVAGAVPPVRKDWSMLATTATYALTSKRPRRKP